MYLPGGLRYDGAALGFNALVIAATVTTEGLTVPWRARHPIFSVGLLYDKVSALAATINIQARAIDFDGQTAISAFTSVLAPVSDDSLVSVTNAVITASLGTIVATSGPILMTAPYLRFRITNNDAVNAITVTLQAILNV